MSGAYVVGYVGDSVGDERRLAAYLPAVETERGLAIPVWRDSDYVDFAPVERDEAQVHLFPRRQAMQYVPGAMVWLAGPALIGLVSRFSEMADLDREFRTWDTTLRGSRWSLELPHAVRHLLSRHVADLEAVIYRYIFDPLEVSHGNLPAAFDLYRAINIEDSVDRSIVSGVYYFCRRDHRRFELVAGISVERGYFATMDEYFAEVTRRIDNLKIARPHERYGVIEDAPVAKPVSVVLPSFVKHISELVDKSYEKPLSGFRLGDEETRTHESQSSAVWGVESD